MLNSGGMSYLGLVLNILGTLGVGLIPYFGMAAGYGGPIKFKSAWWSAAWIVSWLVFIAGAYLSARAPARLG
jgi:hypothetical protein